MANTRSKFTKAEIRDRVKSLDHMRKQRAALEKKIKQVEAELLSVSHGGNTLNDGADGWGFKDVESINWQSMNKALVAKDYGMAEFPQIYEPSYRQTKELLNQLNSLPADSSDAIAQYCKTSHTIRVYHEEES